MVESFCDAPSLRESPLPWTVEPDERRWGDASTGYACLAARGPVGAWCGYVAVPGDHPALGLSYYTDSFDIDDLLQDRKTLADAKIQHAINQISVHGGLTFAGSLGWREGVEEATWWFGFDCAHAGDFSPKMDRLDHPVLGLGCPTGWGGVITYRTLEYTEGQCADLARQLQAVALLGNRKDGSSQQNQNPQVKP